MQKYSVQNSKYFFPQSWIVATLFPKSLDNYSQNGSSQHLLASLLLTTQYNYKQQIDLQMKQQIDLQMKQKEHTN